MKHLLPLLLLLLLAGCPDGTPRGSPGPAPVATPTTAAVTTAVTWASVVERVAARLGDVVKAVIAGNKPEALKAFDAAYFEEYEGEAHTHEVACRQLDPEVDEADVHGDGKKRPVVMLREEQWGQIKAAVKSGAPPEKVRELVDALVAKIREDARKLDTR